MNDKKLREFISSELVDMGVTPKRMSELNSMWPNASDIKVDNVADQDCYVCEYNAMNRPYRCYSEEAAVAMFINDYNMGMSVARVLTWNHAVDRIIAVAKACHEVNRTYCKALGDDSQKAWEEAGFDIQKSSVSGVLVLLASPGTSPEALHISWCEERRATGWTYGAIKDTVAKTHPCLVDYDKLPAEQQAKDVLFSAVAAGSMAQLAKEMFS